MTKTGGAKFDEVWKYFIQDNNQRNGHYSATCYHCDTTWARGKPTVMKAHLANICKSCPEDISKYWRDKLAEQTINYTRTSKQSNLPHNQATITQHFSSNQPLPLQVNSRLDKSLIKMWIITEKKINFKMTKTGGAKFDEVWKYFIQDNNQRNGHYSATCYHCDTTKALNGDTTFWESNSILIRKSTMV
ncbi:hypothetical protein Glove_606g7 [Diversispora epigaea]|uniref:Uncharacterized protein n=1 Tax=Diversispora epigaea TaxID=1348612 RepID=A0A397G6S1_9GLOM|nr:hypothetical protein Glove_606g7 [Diversispora epigaea]